jgi:adenine-specific DNA-methyltransferase
MEKLKMHSLNKVDGNIAKIGQLFPNSLTERKNEKGEVEYAIDFDVLRQELSSVIVEGNEERYQFTWPDKKQSILLANAPIAKTLRPFTEESADFDTTENLYIEGDNLDVLKLLQETYLGKVKMIYIDPPYNTGNDFVYEDDFAQSTDEYLANSGQYDEDGNRLIQNSESNGRFHTDWLNMIYPRLKLAKDLLTDDGVIFISIDDNEVENLKKICDEIFGSDNIIETVIWKNKYGAGAKTVGFISAHEYILCYSKNKISNVTCEFEGEEREKYNKRDEKFSYRGPYRTQPLMTNSLGDRPNLMYTIEHNGTIITPKKQWVWSKERMLESVRNNDVEFSLQKDGSYTVRSKSYLLDENGNVRRGKPVSVLNGPFTQDGTKEIRELFDDKSIFDFSKPSKLVEFFCKLEINDQSDNDFIALDFFSGSAVTAQALMQLNATDGGSRRFIMVQIPELTEEKSEAYKAGYKNICEIGKERIRRAGKKILEEQKTKDNGLFDEEAPKLDIGFRVLKLDSTNMKDVYYNPSEYTPELFSSLTDNIKKDRTSEDLLFQVMLELGVLLSSKIEKTVMNGKTVFNVADGYLIACFEDNINDATVKAIAQQKPYYAVFRDSSMASDSVATNIEQIFATYSPTTERKVL